MTVTLHPTPREATLCAATTWERATIVGAGTTLGLAAIDTFQWCATIAYVNTTYYNTPVWALGLVAMATGIAAFAAGIASAMSNERSKTLRQRAERMPS